MSGPFDRHIAVMLPAFAAGAIGLAGIDPAQSAEAPPPATLNAAQTPLDATGYSADDGMFAKPFIDVDEIRSDGNVRYRYVHGGFNGTDTRFSFHFPENVAWQGRFFQYITPVPDS